MPSESNLLGDIIALEEKADEMKLSGDSKKGRKNRLHELINDLFMQIITPSLW